MIVVTVADRCRHHFPSFEESCERHGMEPVLLGWGWPYAGLGTKPKLLYEWLKQERPQGLILFTDSHDAFLNGSPVEIGRRFRSLKHPFVMSAETNCAPDAALKGCYPKVKSRYRFLNSGGFIAEANHLRKTLERWKVWLVHDRENDQGWFTRRFLEERGAIRLDHGCEVFQCLYNAERDLELQHGRIHNRATGSYPLVIHGNGRSDMRQSLSWAGLETRRWANPIYP